MLHEFIPEYQQTTGRIVSAPVTAFLKDLDSALTQFHQRGTNDRFSGLTALSVADFRIWAEAHIESIAPGIAEDIAALAYAEYVRGYHAAATVAG